MSIINKKKLNELLSLSNDPKIELLEENKKSYKIEINGDKDKVRKSSFENKVLYFMSNMNEFVKEQREFNKNQLEFNKKIESRLDVLENKVDLMMEAPTMKKELSTLPKNKK